MDRALGLALDSLRRGWPVRVGELAVLAVETAEAETLAGFDAGGAADLLVSGRRAVTLKLANQRDAVPTGPVRIARAPWIDLAAAAAIADPAQDLQSPLKGPFRTLALDAPESARAALALCRIAGLLPALFVGGAAADVVTVSVDAIDAFERAPSLTMVSRARLPIAQADKAEIVAFRRAGDGSEHVALLIGAPDGRPPLVRLHSECLTGDVLGSLKCDCGPQLRDALARIGESGWGILLYLRQEGRGIGLVNKLRAYALQDQGHDTVDANFRLGFEDDERGFAVAAAMLRGLGQETVRLLTNNPRKAAGLKACGVAVAERVPLKALGNDHNRAYLETKKRRSGHLL
jgi:GTP cyclohydrolase II